MVRTGWRGSTLKRSRQQVKPSVSVLHRFWELDPVPLSAVCDCLWPGGVQQKGTNTANTCQQFPDWIWIIQCPSPHGSTSSQRGRGWRFRVVSSSLRLSEWFNMDSSSDSSGAGVAIDQGDNPKINFRLHSIEPWTQAVCFGVRSTTRPSQELYDGPLPEAGTSSVSWLKIAKIGEGFCIGRLIDVFLFFATTSICGKKTILDLKCEQNFIEYMWWDSTRSEWSMGFSFRIKNGLHFGGTGPPNWGCSQSGGWGDWAPKLQSVQRCKIQLICPFSARDCFGKFSWQNARESLCKSAAKSSWFCDQGMASAKSTRACRDSTSAETMALAGRSSKQGDLHRPVMTDELVMVSIWSCNSSGWISSFGSKVRDQNKRLG